MPSIYIPVEQVTKDKPKTDVAVYERSGPSGFKRTGTISGGTSGVREATQAEKNKDTIEQKTRQEQELINQQNSQRIEQQRQADIQKAREEFSKKRDVVKFRENVANANLKAGAERVNVGITPTYLRYGVEVAKSPQGLTANVKYSDKPELKGKNVEITGVKTVPKNELIIREPLYMSIEEAQKNITPGRQPLPLRGKDLQIQPLERQIYPSTKQIIMGRFEQVGLGVAKRVITYTEAGLSYISQLGYRKIGGKEFKSVDLTNLGKIESFDYVKINQGTAQYNVSQQGVSPYYFSRDTNKSFSLDIGKKIGDIKSQSISTPARYLSYGFVDVPIVVTSLGGTLSLAKTSTLESSTGLYLGKEFYGTALSSLSPLNLRGGVFTIKNNGETVLFEKKPFISRESLLESINPSKEATFKFIEVPKQETLKIISSNVEPTSFNFARIKSGYAGVIEVVPSGGGFSTTLRNIPLYNYQSVSFTGAITDLSIKGRASINEVSEVLTQKNYFRVSTDTFASRRYENIEGTASIKLSRETLQTGKITSFIDVPSQEANIARVRVNLNVKPEPYLDYTKEGLINQITVPKPYTIKSTSKIFSLEPFDVKSFSFKETTFFEKAVIEPSLSIGRTPKEVLGINKRILVGRELGDDRTIRGITETSTPKSGGEFGGSIFQDLSPSNKFSGLGQNGMEGLFNTKVNYAFSYAQGVGRVPSSPSFKNPFLLPAFNQRSTTIQNIIQSQNPLQKSNQNSLSLQNVFNLQNTNQVTNQLNSQLQNQQQFQNQIPLQTPLQQQVNLNLNIPFRFPLSQKPLEETPFLKLDLKTVDLPKSSKGLYAVQVRRRKKFRTVGVASTPEKAFKIGQNVVENTLGATFKVIGVGNFGIPQGFYKAKGQENTFIQKNIFRLSRVGEKKEIQRARRIKLKL